MRFSALCAVAAILTFTSPARAETLGNDSIIALAKAGLSEGLIIDKINSDSCNYDTSINTLISLKQAGLSEGVIGAMVRRCATLNQQRGVAGDDSSSDPKVKHSPGIYAMENWTSPNKLQVIRPSKPSGTKSSGNGSILFPFVVKMVVPGPTSHVPIEPSNPEFYFYFNVSDTKVSDFGVENSLAAQSPDEFSLVKFIPKGDSREVSMGKASFYGGLAVTMKKGIDAKSTIHFDSEEISPGVFKVTVEKGLPSGEYGFIFTGANGNSRIYDFSIKPSLVSAK